MSWGSFTCSYCGLEQKCRRYRQKYCNVTHQLRFEYETGTRDKQATVSKAHAAIKVNGLPSRKGKPAAWLKSANAEAIKGSISRAKKGVPVLALRKTERKDKSYWKSPEYQAWRKQVMERDNYTCTNCGDNTGGNLEADHIMPVSLFPELMTVLSNGRTLCKPCHYATPTWGAKCKKLTRADFIPVIEG